MLSALRQFAIEQKRKLGQTLLHSRGHPLYLRLTGQPDPVSQYRRWAVAEASRTPPLEDFRRTSEKWPNQPCVSVMLPVHNPKREWLNAAIESVRHQTYTHWELCVCDDASAEPWVHTSLTEAAAHDPRVRYRRSDVRLGIAGALNRASELASGEYFTFLDHDDYLSSVALHYVVAGLQGSPVDFLYSDEDYVDSRGGPVLPHLKPDWSPELLSNCMYVGHPMVVSRECFRSLGGFRSAFDGAQDYDLALRIAEAAAHPAHIPRILYHWRQHPASVAGSTFTKPYTHTAGRRALEDAVRRRGWDATVLEDSIPNQYVLRRHGQVRNEDDILVFSDAGISPERPDWFTRVAAQLERPKVGIAGAKILRADGTIHNCGFAAIKNHLPQAPGQGTHGLPFWKWLNFTREVTAVGGGFLAVRRSLLEQLGGLDPKLPKLGEVDLCLRARRLGLQVIFLHDVVFRRAELEEPTGPNAEERELFAARWNALLPDADPYYRAFEDGSM